MQETWARRDLQENREQEVLNMSSCVHVNKLTSSSPFFFFFFFLANSLFMASSSSVYWPKEFWCPFSCMPSCVSLHVWIAFSSCTLSVSLLFCLVRLLRWTASLSSLTSFPSASCHLFLFCQTPWERHALPMKGSNNLIERLTTETKSKSMMKPFRLTCFSCPSCHSCVFFVSSLCCQMHFQAAALQSRSGKERTQEGRDTNANVCVHAKGTTRLHDDVKRRRRRRRSWSER